MANSRTEKSIRTAAASFLNTTLSKVLIFVSRTVFIHVFGREMLGLNGLFTNVIDILCLADLGFDTAVAYSYYKPIAENDKAKIAALNRFYSRVYLIIAIAVAAAGVACVPMLGSFVNLDSEIEHLYLYYAISVFNTVASYLFAYKRSLISAHQHGYIISRYTAIINTAFTIVRIITMYLTRNYIAYLLVGLASTIVNNLVVSAKADKLYPYIKRSKEELTRADKKGIFGNISSVFLYKLSSVLLNSTDNLLISRMVSTAAVGDYSNYLTPINMLNGYASIAFFSFGASLGNMMVLDSTEKQYRIFKVMTTLSAWLGIVVSSCTFALINEFITIWLGESYLMDNLTVCAICLNFIVQRPFYPIWVYREAAGMYVKTKYVLVITAALNIVLSIIMGKWLGTAGILFASILSKMLTYAWYEPVVLFRDYFEKSPMDFFVYVVKTVVASCIVGLGLRYLVALIPVSGILGFVLKGVVCFVIANIIYLLLYFRNPYFKELIARGKNLFLSKIKRNS